MSDVIPFRKPSLKEKHKETPLCRHGHHKWELDKTNQFDVKQGKLVTIYNCVRCRKQKVMSL